MTLPFDFMDRRPIFIAVAGSNGAGKSIRGGKSLGEFSKARAVVPVNNSNKTTPSE